MTWQRLLGSVFSTAIFLGAPSIRDADAAQVRGVIDSPVGSRSSAQQGHTRVRVAQPAKGWETEHEEVAIVLEVRESARTPPAERVWKVAIEGLKLTPSVVACATDASSAESVEFTNSDEGPATITIGKEQFATLAPGETKAFKCQTAGTHRVRSKEWPHMRGLIFVPERLALTTRPGPDGSFSIVAPQGTYELQVIAASGVVHRQEVKIEARDVDLGRIDLGGKTAKPTEAPGSGKTGEEVP